MVTRKQDPAGAEEASRVARRIQTRQEAADAQAAKKSAKSAKTSKAPKTSKTAVQAGARSQPSRFPAQRLAKPGLEADLALAPRYEAPDYRGSGKLAGFAALVTGADSGIGRAVAVLFAREGADVGIAYLDEHADAKVTLAAVEAEGRRGLLLPGDVRDGAWCERAVEATVEAFGRLDVLVNNAAFQMHAATIEELDDERLDLTFRTNIFGYFHMAKAALPHMGEGGSIVNTGSVTGLKGNPQLLDYSATKGAIHAFTKSLAANVIERGIRVNCVAPGPVWTPLNPADRPPDEVAAFGADTQMKRAAQPEEIAPAYVFLASPACAGYITGIVLPITGSVGAI